MATPVSFAPTPTRTPGLQVTQSLDVRAGKPGGAQLADTVAGLLGIAQPIVQNQLEKKSKESAAQGQADAAIGRVDAKRQAENYFYDRGVKRTESVLAATNFLNDFDAFYETEFDKSQGEDQLLGELNQRAQAALAPFMSDPEMASDVAGIILPAAQKRAAEHRAFLTEQHKERTVTAQSALIERNLKDGVVTDIEAVMQPLRAEFGNSAASEQLVTIVGGIAQKLGRPELIGILIPDKWADGTDGPGNVPRLRDKLNQYKYYAENVRDEKTRQDKAARQAALNPLWVRWTAMAANGVDPTPEIFEAIGKGADIDVKDALPLQSASRANLTFNQSQDNRAYEESIGVIAQLSVDPSAVSIGDISRLALKMSRGRGAAGRGDSTKFMDDAIRLQRVSSSLSGLGKAYQDRLDRFKPGPLAVGERPARLYAEVQFKFAEVYDQTKDAAKAYEAAAALGEQLSTTGKPAGSSTPSRGATGVASQDLAAFNTGTIDAVAFKAQYNTPSKQEAVIAEIERLRAAKKITPEAAIRALDVLAE